MALYKDNDDCLFKEKSIDQIFEEGNVLQQSTAVMNQTTANLELLINSFHLQISNEEQCLTLQKINSLIEYSSDRTNILSFFCTNPILCNDCIQFFDSFQGVGSVDDHLTEHFLNFLKIITNISPIFSFPQNVPVLFILIDKIEMFTVDQQNIIINIIQSIISDIKIPEILINFYHSPQFQKIQIISLRPQENICSNVEKGAQISMRKIFKNLIELNDQNLANCVLSAFFDVLQNINVPNIDQYIIDISYEVANAFPEVCKIVYQSLYFPKLFSFLSIDNNLSFFAFRLLTIIIRQVPETEIVNIKPLINWRLLLMFFDVSGTDLCRFHQMLVFCATLLRFDRLFFLELSQNGFFDKLFGRINNMSFQTKTYAVNVIINGILYGSNESVMELFQRGSLQFLLYVLEQDSNQDMTKDILQAIKKNWEVCECFNAKVDFINVFIEESGYEVLLNLETCADEANELNNIIGDPIEY